MHLSLFTTFLPPPNILICPPNIFDKSTPVVVGSKRGGRWVLKVQKKEAHSTGLRVSSRDFYFIYTNHSISEDSPLWKVFSSHIPTHYRIHCTNISWRPHDPQTPKSGV